MNTLESSESIKISLMESFEKSLEYVKKCEPLITNLKLDQRSVPFRMIYYHYFEKYLNNLSPGNKKETAKLFWSELHKKYYPNAEIQSLPVCEALLNLHIEVDVNEGIGIRAMHKPRNEHEPHKSHPGYNNYADTKRLTVALDMPCAVCNLKKSQIQHLFKIAQGGYLEPDLAQKILKAKNQHALQIELHHYHVEFSYSRTVNIARANATLIPEINSGCQIKDALIQRKNSNSLGHLENNSLVKHLFDTSFRIEKFNNKEQLEAFVIGSPLNMKVLCSGCHRGSITGIHHLDGPLWQIISILEPQVFKIRAIITCLAEHDLVSAE
jgi:hypothetical protein